MVDGEARRDCIDCMVAIGRKLMGLRERPVSLDAKGFAISSKRTQKQTMAANETTDRKQAQNQRGPRQASLGFAWKRLVEQQGATVALLWSTI
jgi:hypothetical protein